MQQGWIKLYRQIIENDLWSAEKFDKAHAWIDLLLLANHTDKKMIMGNQYVTIERGSLITSYHKLADRWNWSVKTVSNFFKLLESDEMVHIKSTNRYTQITIVNYEYFQAKEDDEETQDSTQNTHNLPHEGNTEETQRKHKLPTNKNDKNYKNVNNEENGKNVNNIYILSKIAPEKDDIQSIVDEYNLICVSLPKVYKVSDKRRKAIKSLLKTYTRDDITTVFEKAESSDFLSGRDNKWTSCGFDWLTNSSNFLKVIEGNYDNKGSSGNAYMDAVKNRVDVVDSWV